MISELLDSTGVKYIFHADAKQNCTFKLGGTLEYLVLPQSLSQLVNVLMALENYPYKVVGNMSNILPDDGLNRGIYISTKQIADKPQIFGNHIFAFAGTNLSYLCKIAQQNGLGGIEGLVGIPATVGGAVLNNAGAYGCQISDVIESILVYKNKTITAISASDAQFEYHSSALKQSNFIVLGATLALKKSSPEQILKQMKEFAYLRAKSQPNLPSAGSVFKKHNSTSAGYLIEQAGIKGEIYGGAQISDKHANFIVNLGNATSSSVKYLVNLAQQKVKEKFDITLEREIEYLGETDENFCGLSHT